MAPNYTVNPINIPNCPFSTELHYQRFYPPAEVRTHVFVYPVHMSGAFLLTPTLSSALYLVVLRLLARSYDLASRLITICDTDSPMSAEEKVDRASFVIC